MSEELLNDDQSHYEVSLTAGQAFLAFVLLLLSIAASFAFGLIIGRGQGDERLVVKKEPAVISEASATPKRNDGRIVELGVKDGDFKPDAATAAEATPLLTEETASSATVAAADSAATPPRPVNPNRATEKSATPASAAGATIPAQHELAPAGSAAPTPYYAQLLSSTDQRTAESLAAKLIDRGFTSAYVDRATSAKGPIYKVRVKFGSETEARAAEPKLREFSNDIWITAR